MDSAFKQPKPISKHILIAEECDSISLDVIYTLELERRKNKEETAVNMSDQLMHEVVVPNIYEGNMEGLRGLAATCGRAVERPALHGSSH